MAEVKKLVTPVFRANFPQLFEAQSFQGSKPKFSVAALWEPGTFNDKDKARWNEILKAMNAASIEAFKKPMKELPANFKIGIHDGEEKAEMNGYGKGIKFATLSTMIRPGVVTKSLQKIGPEEGNADLMYSGCYCRATVSVYAFDNVSKGIAIGLMNIQKVADGDRLDSQSNAADDFCDDVDADEDFMDDIPF